MNNYLKKNIITLIISLLVTIGLYIQIAYGTRPNDEYAIVITAFFLFFIIVSIILTFIIIVYSLDIMAKKYFDDHQQKSVFDDHQK